MSAIYEENLKMSKPKKDGKNRKDSFFAFEMTTGNAWDASVDDLLKTN
jgi:hypothetical protein